MLCLEYVQFIAQQVIEQCGCSSGEHSVDCNYVEALFVLKQIDEIGASDLIKVWRPEAYKDDNK